MPRPARLSPRPRSASSTTGASTTAMGSNYPQYAHNDGAPHIQNVYHHNNTQNMVWGNDREMMTCDGGGGVYFGGATSVGTAVSLANAASGAQPGGAMCVLAGTGTGECRRVVSARAGPPPPPPPPGPTSPLAANSAAVLVPCADSRALRFGELPAGGGELREGKFAACVLCDPPGKGSSSIRCGENPYFEPVVFNAPDPWTQQFGTTNFTLSGAELKLVKGGGKCLGAATTKPVAGDALGMCSCAAASASAQWAYTGGKFALHNPVADDAQPQLCMGYSAAAPGPPPGSKLTFFTVDRAFTVPLDRTSKVSITPYIGARCVARPPPLLAADSAADSAARCLQDKSPSTATTTRTAAKSSFMPRHLGLRPPRTSSSERGDSLRGHGDTPARTRTCAIALSIMR